METSTVRILHVDDEPDFADTAAALLEREDERFSVTTAQSVEDGLDRIADEEFDCIVSDYDMPGQDGIAFLEAVRETYPDLPFILFTGKGSEEVASNAISAGVTDYLQKETGSDHYTLLANRINNAVEKYQTQTALERSEDRYRMLMERAPIPILIYSEDAELIDVNEAAVDFFNADDDGDILGKEAYEFTHAENDTEVRDRIDRMLTEGEPAAPSQQKIVALDGEIKHAIVVSAPIRYNGAQAIQTIAYDITERVERERQLKHERDRFESLFETLPEPTVLFSGEDRIDATVSRVNEAFREVFGFEESAIRDEHLNDLIVPDDKLSEALEIDRRNVHGGIEPQEVRRQTADGTLRDFLLLTTNITEPRDDGIAEGFAIYADITEQKQAQRTAERERTRFKQLFETLPEPTAIVSGGEGLTIKQVNPAFEAVFGYDEAAIQGEDLNTLIVPPEYEDEAANLDDIALEGGVLRQEVERQTADGSRRNFLMFATGEFEIGPEEDAEGFVIYADITDRKEREEILKTLHDIATDMTTLQDPTAIGERAVEAAELVFDFDNCAMFLAEDDRLPIVAISDAYSVGDIDSLPIEETAAGETYRTGESMIIEDTATEPIADPIGPYRSAISIPIGEHGVFQVVSETVNAFDESDLELAELLVAHVEQALDRIERENEFRETNRRLEAVLDTVSAAILMKDPDGRYMLMNREGREWAGIPEDAEITEFTTDTLFPEELAAEIHSEDQHILETGETLEIEEEMPLETGTKPLLTIKSPVYDESGDPYGICSVSTDISEQKQREEELIRQNERLEEFTSIVSHDLRNPLAILDSSLELAEQTGNAEDFDRCRRAIDRMDTLIEDLLTLARQGETVGELETVELAEQATKAWQNVATETAMLDTEADIEIQAAPDRLQQLLENLFHNAIEHGGDDVTVTVGRVGDGFYIEDDGRGIPAEDRERVFESGYSTAADGTGFGLAIVKEIVEAHGWSIEATESDEGGARFELHEVKTVSRADPA
ncbi:MAG: PAS domain S-box protein [Halobacteriales archaeon]